jgi:signal peptidase II
MRKYNMKKNILKYSVLILITVTGFSIDIYTKNWAFQTLKDKHKITIVKGFVECGYTENRGMIFGILNRSNTNFIYFILRHATPIGTFILILFLIISRKHSFFYLLPYNIILSGALGNSYDKITKGFVIDFIHIHFLNILDWPFYFNIADALICIGMGILITEMIFVPSVINITKKADEPQKKKVNNSF